LITDITLFYYLTHCQNTTLGGRNVINHWKKPRGFAVQFATR